ncbi:MAG: TonB family protein [Synergistaceae bacterium]|nr:TonB family protein [Synergistaceae bacterium]
MNFSSGAAARWRAAVAISLALHLALLFIVRGELPREEEPPVMEVRLVTLPAAEKAGAPPKRDEPPAPVKKESAKAAIVKKPLKKEAVKTVKKEVKKEIKKENVPVEEIAVKPSDEVNTASAADIPAVSDGGGLPDSSASGEGTGGSESGSGSALSGSGGVLDLSALEVTRKEMPEYPLFSRKRREEGRAVVIVRVDNGKVTAAELEESSGYERLDASALRAARGWRFRHDGQIRVRIPFSFKIRN